MSSSLVNIFLVLLITGCFAESARAQGPLRAPNQSLRSTEDSSLQGSLSDGLPSDISSRRLPLPERLPNAVNSNVNTSRVQPEHVSTPETLEESWALALAVDHRLKERELVMQMAELQFDRARRDRWPNLTVDSSYTVRDHAQAFTFQHPALPPGSVFNYQQKEDFSLDTRIDLPLYTSGRISHSIAAAAAGLDASSLELDEYRRRLKLTVGELYVAVLRAQSGLRVAESNVLSLGAHLKNVQILRENERVPQNDLLAAQVEHSQAKQKEIHASHQLESSRAAYNRQIGRPLDAPVFIAELPPSTVIAEVAEMTDLALRQRPELTGVSAQIRQAQGQADSRRASGKPQIGLLGQYQFQENQYQRFEGSTSLGVGVTWNAWDSGRNRLDAAKLTSRVERLAHHRAELQSQIALEVRRTWLDVRETRHRIEVAKGAVGRAEENLRVVSMRYRAGTEIGAVVLDAQSLLARTQSNHSASVYDSVLAELRLRFATGSL